MSFAIITGIGMVLAFLAALGGLVMLMVTVKQAGKRPDGFMIYSCFAILLASGLSIYFSGRNLSGMIESYVLTRGFLPGLVQRAATVFLMLAAMERVISFFIRPNGRTLQVGLLLGFLTFWTGSVLVPAFLAAHQYLSPYYLYSLIMGVGAVFAGAGESERFLRITRNTLVGFMLISLALIPIKPAMVLELSYAQGFLPGVPRLVGLATHAVPMGMLAQLTVLTLWMMPIQRPWLNRISIAAGLIVLVLAQSKTAWISIVVCSLCILLVNGSSSFWRDFKLPKKSGMGILVLGATMCVASIALAVILFGDVDTRLDRFFASGEGNQLTTMTGRTRVWEVAVAEWKQNPVFGYGLSFLNEAYRASIGIPDAVHAHNQFYDTLARAGTVGVIALFIYTAITAWLAVRYARISKGFSLALFMALALRATSEVPLAMHGVVGNEFIGHLMLLVMFAGYGNAYQAERADTRDKNRDLYPRRRVFAGAPAIRTVDQGARP